MSRKPLGVRLALALGATFVAIVLFLNFQTPPAPLSLVKPPALTTPGPSAQPTVLHTGTFTGSPVTTFYGTTEVVITVSGGRITDVQAPILPRDRSFSDQISTYVAPIFRQEALAAQSAQINAVSGATYTSGAYAQSLQSAIDKAHA